GCLSDEGSPPPAAPAAFRRWPPASPVSSVLGGGWKIASGGWKVAAGTADRSAGGPLAPAGTAPAAAGDPVAGSAKRTAAGPAASVPAGAAAGCDAVCADAAPAGRDPPGAASGAVTAPSAEASVSGAAALGRRRAPRRRPLAGEGWSSPACPAGGGLPARAGPAGARPAGVSISGERAPLRSSPLGSVSFSSVSSIRVISRQAPGRRGQHRVLGSAQELVERARRERAGRPGRLRSEARCVYLVVCPAQAIRRYRRPRRLPQIARHFRSGGFGRGTGGLHAERPLRQPRHQRW